MNTKRLWKRESQFYPEYHGKSFMEEAHIKETVHIDITEEGLSPSVTCHDDGTIAIHDIVKWGSLLMTTVQATHLIEKLTQTILHRGMKL